MDEATFNVQTTQRRSFALKSDPNQHLIESIRLNITVFCAVGACLDKPVFM